MTDSDDLPSDFSRAISADRLTRLRSGLLEPGDVAGLRRMFALDLATFANVLGITPALLERLESSAEMPERPVRALIALIARHPRIVTRRELPIAA